MRTAARVTSRVTARRWVKGATKSGLRMVLFESFVTNLSGTYLAAVGQLYFSRATGNGKA